VTGAGDVNGDGFGDLLVSAPYHDNGQVDEGQVFLYLGGPDRMKSTPWSYPGPLSGWRGAWSVACAGDVNGDHFDDFLSGDPFASSTQTNEGRVLLWYGGPNGPAAGASWQIFGGQAGGQLGVSVARAGDVNGDGYGDVIVGADTYNSTGAAWVYYMPPSSGIPPTPLFGPSVGSHFGNPVASAGDVNGDGYGDVIVGAPYDDTPATDAGRAFVYLGGPLGLNPTPQIALAPSGLQLANAHFGSSVACAGDYNGDGYDDVAVGEPNRDYQPDPDSGIIPQAGQYDLYVGSASGVQAGAIDGATWAVAGWGTGSSVASAGDVNGDGYADVVVGTPFANSSTGLVDVFGGGPGISHPHLFSRNGDQAGSAFANSVASAGDINGDGLSDIVVGAVFEDNGAARDAGAVFVWKSPLQFTPAETFLGDNAFDNFGHVVAGGMDLNGDGFSDVACGAPGDDVGGISDRGSANIWFGNAGIGMDRTPYQRSGSHDVQPLGGTDYTQQMFIGGRLRSAGGATRVALQYDASPALGSSGLSYAGRSPLTWTSAPGVNGSYADVDVRLDSLKSNARYRWRERTRTTSPFFSWSPWTSFARNGRTEAKFRTSPGAADVPPAHTLVHIALDAPAPNPAVRSSAIEFVLPANGPVALGIYDVQGKRVRDLISGEQAAGRHRVTWDGHDGSGHLAPAGVYFYRLEAAGSRIARRLVWLR
jgi:hypothetical protein